MDCSLSSPEGHMESASISSITAVTNNNNIVYPRCRRMETRTRIDSQNTIPQTQNLCIRASPPHQYISPLARSHSCICSEIQHTRPHPHSTQQDILYARPLISPSRSPAASDPLSPSPIPKHIIISPKTTISSLHTTAPFPTTPRCSVDDSMTEISGHPNIPITYTGILWQSCS